MRPRAKRDGVPRQLWARSYCDRRVLTETSAHVIYVGIHRRTHRKTVIKVARDDCAPLARELAALTRVQGPGVVRLVEVHGVDAIALGHVHGVSLARRMERLPLSARELIALAKRLEDVLARIAAAGFVHGDLKPDNVLLPRGSIENAVLIDFETAAAIGEPTSPRVTAAYVAPERLIAAGPADSRSDLFSLGALLVAAATGASPFEAETRDATILRVLAHEAPALANVPDWLAARIACMLAKQPEARTLPAWPSGRRTPTRQRQSSVEEVEPELESVMIAIDRAAPGERIALRGPGARRALDSATRRFAKTSALLTTACASEEPYGALIPELRRRLGIQERAPISDVALALRRHRRSRVGERHVETIAELIGSPLGSRARRLDFDALARSRQDAILFVLGRSRHARPVVSIAVGIDPASTRVLDALLHTSRDAVVVLEDGAFAGPARVIDVPARRLAPTPNDTLLAQASMWHTPFERDDLVATIDASREEIHDALERWTTAGIVVPDPFGTTWRFVDTSAQQHYRKLAVEASWPSLNYRIGAWIAARHPRANAAIARHFADARQPLRAAYYAWRAAQSAQEGGDLEQASTLLSLADAQLASVVSGTVRTLLSALLDVVRAQVLRWQGRHADASMAARRALASLPVGSVAWCEALGERATAAGKLGDPNEVLAVASALRAEPSTEAATAWDRACSRTAVQLFHHGRRSDARELVALFRATTTNARGKPDAGRRGLSPGALVYESLYDGRLDEHARLLEQSARAFDEIGDERSAILYSAAVGFAYAQLGDYARAEHVLVKTRTRAMRSISPTLVTLVDHNLGEVLARRGKLKSAIAVESAAIDSLRRQGDVRFLAASLAYRARMRLASGDFESAESDAREGVEHGGGVGSLVPLLFATLGEVLLEKRQAAEALVSVQKACAALVDAGPVEAGESLAHLVFARANLACGDTQAATESACAAWHKLQAQASTFTPRGARRTFLQNISEHRALRRLAEAR